MASDDRVFGWARDYDADQLAAFIEDLWGAASGDNDLETLDAIEKVIAEHRPPVPMSPLTPRQTEVLTHLANGCTYKEAGEHLGLSIGGVDTVLSYVYDRLGVQSKTHAAAVAAEHGWLPGLHIPQPDTPLARRKSPRRAAFHQEAADRLRAAPGTALDIGAYATRHTARSTARAILTASYRAYEPAGSFDAFPARGDDGFWCVKARYTGQPTTAEGTES